MIYIGNIFRLLHATCLVIAIFFVIAKEVQAQARVTNTSFPHSARGLNIDSALESSRFWHSRPTAGEFQVIAGLGFNAVRLPFKVEGHLNQDGTISSAFLKRLSNVTEMAHKAGLMVLVDLHDRQISSKLDERSIQEIISIWQQVEFAFVQNGLDANSTKDWLAFEVLNEPFGVNDAIVWARLQREIVKGVRRFSPQRKLVLTGARWSELESLNSIDYPRDDANLLFTFHYYTPMWFTHRMAPWVKPEVWQGEKREWSSQAGDLQKLRRDFSRVSAWARDNRAALFMGEFGVFEAVPDSSRAVWVSEVRHQAEQQNMGWFYWSYSGDFGIYDPKSACWRGKLISALFDGIKSQQNVKLCHE
jgi:endoglucanase